MIEIIWPNGELTTGRTWRELEDAARATQWTTFETRKEFRDEMRHRAFVWCGIMPRTSTASSEDFMRSLADVNMFMIVNEQKEGNGKVKEARAS